MKRFLPGILFCLCMVNASAQSPYDSCVLVLKRSFRQLYQFQPNEASQLFREGAEISRRISNDSLYAQSLFGMAQASWYTGHFQNAADSVNLAIKHFAPGDNINLISAFRVLSNIYDDMGEYEKAFIAIQKALELNERGDKQNTILSFVQMGKLYKNISDYKTAREYYNRAFSLSPMRGEYAFRELNYCMGELMLAMENPDSARYYYRQALIGNPKSRIIQLRISELLIFEKKPDSARAYLEPALLASMKANDVNMATDALISLAHVDELNGRINDAIAKAIQADTMSKHMAIFRHRLKIAKILTSLYEKTGRADLALRYQKRVVQLNEAALSDVYKGQMFAFRQKTQLAEQSATLQRLQNEKRLAQQTILIVALIAVIIILTIIFKSNNEKLRLKQRAAEMEMQALRAQMNPHFMFNCLSAINHFILNSENDKASDYLTRFSRLMRVVLVNAGKRTVSLEEELDMVKLYLEMEQLRFKDAFIFSIDIAPGLQPSQTNLPCFILQPFCENAIWHGLLHKPGKGWLKILCTRNNNALNIVIRDNGIGINKAKEAPNSRRESMGLRITADRLALWNNNNKKNKGSQFEIREWNEDDGLVGGTEVILTINNTNDESNRYR